MSFINAVLNAGAGEVRHPDVCQLVIDLMTDVYYLSYYV